MLSLLVALAAVEAVQPAPASPRAIELFERDRVLMEWGRRRFDRDGDGILGIAEAQVAAAAFKAIADGNRDGRVTTWEYGRAREFIVARY